MPCGHVTLVSAMHLGKAFVISNSSGVKDYVQHGENAIVCEAFSPDDGSVIAFSGMIDYFATKSEPEVRFSRPSIARKPQRWHGLPITLEGRAC